MSGASYFQIQHCGDVPVLHLQTIGFDRTAINQLGQELFAFLDEHHPPRLALNLAAVSELSSPMLARLMMLDKRMTAYGGKMLLCEARGSVREVISLAWPASLGPEAEPLSQAQAVQRLRDWTGLPAQEPQGNE